MHKQDIIAQLRVLYMQEDVVHYLFKQQLDLK